MRAGLLVFSGGVLWYARGVMGMTRFVVFALVALTLTLFTWLGGGIVAQWLRPWALWLALLTAEVALLVPEQRRTESLFEARRRVWRGVARDPLTWLSAALCLYLTVQWVNACTFLEWDAAARAWRALSPAFEGLRHPETAAAMALPPTDVATEGFRFLPQPWAWLPWSLRADEARGVLDWFVPSLVAALAARHALLGRSKRMLLAFVCAMASALAVAGIVQFAVGGEFLYWGMKSNAFFFATFGYPNHAACFFPAVMALSVGMALWAAEHREHTRAPPWAYGLAAALCGASGILSGSRAGMLFTLAVTAVTALYVPLRYFASWPGRLRLAVPVLLLAVAVSVVGTAGFRIYATRANRARAEAVAAAKSDEERAAASRMPRYTPMPSIDAVFQEIDGTEWGEFFAHPMLMRSGYQGILALRQHADHPWFGTGAWSFRWLNARYIDATNPEEQKWFANRMGVGQANVHNDTLQFLAEHGWVGFGLMLGCVAALVLPFLKALFVSPAHTVSDAQADRCWLNRLNVACLFVAMATALIALHSFIDLVFRSPACLLLYALMLVCAPACVLGARRVAVPPELSQEPSHA